MEKAERGNYTVIFRNGEWEVVGIEEARHIFRELSPEDRRAMLEREEEALTGKLDEVRKQLEDFK